ncbi:MAG: 6-phosphofructokinase [Planctomycetaceae bacterium]|nr:6-phosphofructokinase [Planctomycetaceae bacterium]
MSHGITKVALLFSGGPAPAANAVISTCAISCINNGVDVVGIRYGYSNLINYSPDRPLQEDNDYLRLHEVMLRRTRSKQGILIGTARANPGKHVSSPEDLKDPEKVAPLKRVYEGLRSIGVDALVSIGGDDTLKTANKFKLFQQSLPADAKRIPVVHVPKTIDNDYMGIDFTFGYFTAVETLGTEIRNLHADAEAGRAYFVVESMGRSAGWLAYGAAISGEASMVISVEDITEKYLAPESTPDRKVMNIDKVVEKIVRLMRYRQDKQGKEYGVVVLAEGLAEYLSDDVLKDVPRDDHGHISVAHVDLGKMFARRVAREFERQTGTKRKVTGLQLGYESRCARPHSFDVMLGSQLGVGAYRALCEEKHNGVMVSVSGQLDLHYVPFEKLVDPATLVTVVRFIQQGSDFHKLARFLETSIND